MILLTHICNILTPPPILPASALEQRVKQRVHTEQQRVINNTPIVPIQRISNAPEIMAPRNPMAKWSLKMIPRAHQHQTRNNTPGGSHNQNWHR
jgi:hypothetical protein